MTRHTCQMPAGPRSCLDMAFAERGEPVKMENKTHTQTVGVAPAAQSRKVWAAAGLLVVAVSVAYANSFHGPFIFDDDPSIVENKSIRHLGSPQVLAAPPDAVTTTGRPVVNLSLAVNYAIGGLNVEGYHAVNLAIHILAALALWSGAADACSASTLSRGSGQPRRDWPWPWPCCGPSPAPDRVGHLCRPTG
jgi:hypothetical protein